MKQYKYQEINNQAAANAFAKTLAKQICRKHHELALNILTVDRHTFKRKAVKVIGFLQREDRSYRKFERLELKSMIRKKAGNP